MEQLYQEVETEECMNQTSELWRRLELDAMTKCSVPSLEGVLRESEIEAALDRLQAGGSTAGGEGINLAYKIARDNFIEQCFPRTNRESLLVLSALA